MGFSLVGNSGDQTTQTTVYTTNYSASLNPQLDLQNSGAGASAINLSPLLQGSSIASYAPAVASFFAPINLTSAGDNSTPAQIAALAGAQAAQTGASEASGTSTLSSLFSGNGIYYVLAGIVLLFLAHHKN